MSMNENERLWSVYRHTSPSNKVYIGIAKDVKHRWRGDGSGYKGSNRIYYAIKKYGWDNFKHDIIATNLTREEACEMEIDLINKYHSTDPKYGYNLREGGQHGTLSPESIEKLKTSLKGHPVSDKVRKLLAEINQIPIICIETKEIFESAVAAADKMSLCRTSVSRAARGKQDTCGGYHFAWLSDYENGTVKKFIPKPAVYTKVRCITTGEEFNSICEASRKTGLSRRGISYACNGVYKTCGKMQWEFIKPEQNDYKKEVSEDVS